MSITTLDGYIASNKQIVPFVKSGSNTNTAYIPVGLNTLQGYPPSIILNIGNTVNGIVPTDLTLGYPRIKTFGVGNTGYITRVSYYNSQPGVYEMFDALFSCGSYSFNSNVTLNSQPVFTSRIPNANYAGTQLWYEQNTLATGLQQIIVTYTNQDGVSGRVTQFNAQVVLKALMCVNIPLTGGDSGIMSIQSVVASVAAAGTFNLHILRPLWSARVGAVGQGEVHSFEQTGMPVVFDNSAFRFHFASDLTNTGVSEIYFEIANG